MTTRVVDALVPARRLTPPGDVKHAHRRNQQLAHGPSVAALARARACGHSPAP